MSGLHVLRRYLLKIGQCFAHLTLLQFKYHFPSALFQVSPILK